LVNNAGVSWQGTLDTYDQEQVARMRRVNVDGVIHATRAVIGSMRAQRYGRIVNVASIAGIGTALAGNAFYAATKAEVLILTRRFALELGQHGITVNAVAPGLVRTELTQRGRGAADWPGTEERFAQRAINLRAAILTMLDFELSTNLGLSFEAQSTGTSFLPPSMTRKRGQAAGGSSGTSLSAHSGQASDGWFMNHLRWPNCGCGTIIQPHRSSARVNSSAAGPITTLSALASSARSVGRRRAIDRSCKGYSSAGIPGGRWRNYFHWPVYCCKQTQ
jgi:hypothetical protein